MLGRIKKNDMIHVLSGKDKGKQGRVIVVDPKKEKVLVKGISIVTRHVKAKKQGQQSGIIKEESYIPLCIVMPVCSRCNKACRIRTKSGDGKSKLRVCHRCEEAF
jgi:large subunit ribosomal protein L24